MGQKTDDKFLQPAVLGNKNIFLKTHKTQIKSRRTSMQRNGQTLPQTACW